MSSLALIIITFFLTLFLIVETTCLLTGNSEFIDGDLVISSSSDTILNRYYKVVRIDETRANLTLLATIEDSDDLGLVVGSGSLVFIYQPNGITMEENDGDWFGSITNLGSAGVYEFGVVRFSDSEQNVVVLNSPLLRDFELSNFSSVQMVVVPQYRNLTVASGARVRCEAWNSTRVTG